MEKIILVDKNDRETGTGEKMEVHRSGKLHRAFSIFIFNSRGQLLLQKRSREKYHSGGLWTNTCCSHPRAGEKLDEAVHRRLKEEMGFDVPLKEIFSFVYKVKFGNGLYENEYDHVFVGRFDGEPKPNPKEAESWKWVSLQALKNDIEKNPEKYTYWLRASINKLISKAGIKAEKISF
ncbi:MAG: isopentenyl-diphosphate Delta-isomerase [Candidatus Aenigmatarchaeota archaeon]